MKKISFVLLCSIILTSCIGGTSQDNIEDTIIATGSNENLEVEGLHSSVNDSSIVDEASESKNTLDDELKIDDIEEQVSSKDADMEIEVIETEGLVVEEKEGENVVSEKKVIEPDLTYWLKQYYPDTDVRKSRILYEEDKYVYGDYLYWNDYLEDYSIKYFFGVKKKTRYLIFKDIDPLYHAYCSTFESLPVNFIPDCIDNNSNIVFTKNPSVFYKGMTVEDRKIVHDMMGISDSGEEYEGKTYCLISDISYNYIDAGCHAVGGIGGFRLVYGKKDGRWGEAFSGHDISEVSGLEFKVVVNDDGSYEKVFSFTKFQD